ncbi:MAG: outer membrane lipoprotein LolB [Betaproteobacteria bacterium]
MAIFPGVAAVLLAACVAPAIVPPMPAAPGAYPASVFFRLQGRLSVRVGDKIEIGHIRWARLPGEERLEISTPFGGQIAEIVKPANGDVVMRRSQEIVRAKSIGELTASLLGVPLDMDAIARWTQGIGLAEDEPVEQQFGNGDTWQVTVERLRVAGAFRYASRLSALRGDVVVRLVIDEWQAE